MIELPKLLFTFLPVALVFTIVESAVGLPRPPLPPIPEGTLSSQRFDDASLRPGTEVLVNAGGRLVESWSGYALQMSDTEPALVAFAATSRKGKANLSTDEGAIRFWFAPHWESDKGPGYEARLLEVGAWSATDNVSWWSLVVSADGSTIRLLAHDASPPLELLQARISWAAGAWHQVAFAWSPQGTVLFLDGKRVAEGPAVSLAPISKFEGRDGFCLGSDVQGRRLAQGEFDELYTFGHTLSEEDLLWNYYLNAPRAEMGPVSPEEEALWMEAAAAAAEESAQLSQTPSRPDGRDALLQSQGECASELQIVRGTDSVDITIINATPGKVYDLYRTFHLEGNTLADAHWQKIASGVNGQTFTFPLCTYPLDCVGQEPEEEPGPPSPVVAEFYLLGCDQDTDGDGLTDAFERLVNKTAIDDADTDDDGFSDLQEVNILVNDLMQDCGNEQNSQFESSCVMLNGNLIVAYVDSNQGVYGLGQNSCDLCCLPGVTPRFVGYSVSLDGGATFQDQGAPPLSTQNPSVTNDDGDAGDPVLAADETAAIVYLAGTSPRNAGYKGVPVWKSTDGGVTFGQPTTVHDEILNTDKPWIAVDNAPNLAPGDGQGDVYVSFTSFGQFPRIWLTVSTDQGATWSTLQQVQNDGPFPSSAIPVVGADHVAYVFWFERQDVGGNILNTLKVRSVFNHGTILDNDIFTVRSLITTDPVGGNLNLKRSNDADDSDTFRAFPLPVPAANPNANKAGHLYVAYADKAQNSDPNDRADVFLVKSTDEGATWSDPPVRLSTVPDNDQWMPVLAVKPDGTRLFVAWYDRRDDPNNSLIHVYGRFATIASNGDVIFDPGDFRITTVNFPPVFAGTLPENQIIGHYDPVYPPEAVDLYWHYCNYGWQAPPPSGDPDICQTAPTYRDHVGEYNGAWAEAEFVYLTWTDYRLRSPGSRYGRYQSDSRMVKLSWFQ